MSLGRDHWGHLSCLFCKVSIFAPGLCESWSEEYMVDIAFGAAFPVSHRALKLCKHKHLPRHWLETEGLLSSCKWPVTH